MPKGASELTLFYNEPGLFTKQRYEINLMETTPQPLPLQSEVTLEEHEQNLTQEKWNEPRDFKYRVYNKDSI